MGHVEPKYMKCGARWPAYAARIALSLLLLLPVASAIAAEWTEAPPMYGARVGIGTAVIDRDIYVAGGGGISAPETSFDLFDSYSEFWRSLPAMPEGLSDVGIATSGGRIYIAGGRTGSTAAPLSDRLWIYAPDRSLWLPGPAMPAPRAGHVMVELDGALYIVGGEGKHASRLYRLDIGADKWSIVGPAIPTPRGGLAAVIHERKLYTIGGRTKGGRDLATVEIYDPERNSWRKGPSLPAARSGPAAGVLEGRLHVAGGETKDPPKTHDGHYVLENGSWRSLDPLPTPRGGAASVVVGNRWYVIGGGAGAGFYSLFTATDVVEVYGP